MAVTFKVPITTAVLEDNPEAVVGTEFENGVAVILLDARRLKHREILGIGRGVKLHWSKDARTYEAQELSSFPWPIRYRVTTADAWYVGPDGARVHYSPPIRGLDSHSGVSQAVKRAAVLLAVIGAIGYRRVAWLLQELFRVCTSKSALARWVKDVAAQLPSKAEMVQILNEQKPITEGHFDEIFPRGRAGPGCVLVLKDEHGRIVATQRVVERTEEAVKVFLEWLRDRGLGIKTFYIDTCRAYRNAIPQVFPGVRIQLDLFHIIQNVWRHLWKFFVARRRAIKANAEESETPWYKAKLKALADALWKNRHILFKSEKNLKDDERQTLAEICSADQKVGRIRTFLCGVWKIFDGSKDETEARKALDALKAEGYASESKHHERALKFLDDTFDEATTYLREKGVQRNSLAESGMRTLRRLEQEHDGFRTDDSREDFLRIYQAVKYLDWSVYGPAPRRARHRPP
ncbi:MAG: transposase [Planctomycetota bacterium]